MWGLGHLLLVMVPLFALSALLAVPVHFGLGWLVLMGLSYLAFSGGRDFERAEEDPQHARRMTGVIMSEPSALEALMARMLETAEAGQERSYQEKKEAIARNIRSDRPVPSDERPVRKSGLRRPCGSLPMRK